MIFLKLFDFVSVYSYFLTTQPQPNKQTNKKLRTTSNLFSFKPKKSNFIQRDEKIDRYAMNDILLFTFLLSPSFSPTLFLHDLFKCFFNL